MIISGYSDPKEKAVDSGFYIFQDGRFQNRERLSAWGRGVYHFFTLLFSSKLNDDFFVKNVTGIKVTSQYRPKSKRHKTGRAIDIQIEPFELMPVYFCILHKYFTLNIHLSLFQGYVKAYNEVMGGPHLHLDAAYDVAGKNNKWVEILRAEEIILQKPKWLLHKDLVVKWYKTGTEINDWLGDSWFQSLTDFRFDEIYSLEEKNDFPTGSGYSEAIKEAWQSILKDIKSGVDTLVQIGKVAGVGAGIYLIYKIFKE